MNLNKFKAFDKIFDVMSDNIFFSSSDMSANESSTVISDESMFLKSDPLHTVIPMTVLYVLILLTGVIGNLITCAVIARNRYMHTATNYYLFSLAISDLLLLMLGLPQEIYMLWQKYPYAFGEVFCVIRGFTSEASTNSSVLTITAFTIERYVAICHPLKAHTMSKLSRAFKLIIIIWVLGVVCAVPIAYQFGIVYDSDENGDNIPISATCSIERTIPYLGEHIFTISSLLVFVIPVTIISVLYMLIGLKLRYSASVRNKQMTANNSTDCETNGRKGSTYFKYQSTKRPIDGRSSSSTNSNGLSQRRAVIKMLIAVVVAFFVCFAPFHAQRLMAIYVKIPTPSEVIFHTVLAYISGVTYYLSATINPILYSIMSLKFRQAFKDTFVRCCAKQRNGNRLGKFNGSASSYARIQFNSTRRATLSRTELTQCSDGNGFNSKTQKTEDSSDFIPLSTLSTHEANDVHSYEMK